MAYIGKSIESGTFSVLDTSGNTYNGSNTTFSLGTQVGSPAQLLVSHDGVIQKPGTDYTLATGGTQITFTTAPASGASIFIVEISGAVGGPLDSDLNGTELILDADGDTSITADTDDQIDIKIAGADDFQFTANTFTANSGSGIVIPDGGLTLGSTAVSSTAAELNILDGVTATAAEINLIDGGTARGTTAIADGDGVLINDAGTMRMTNVTTLKTYMAAEKNNPSFSAKMSDHQDVSDNALTKVAFDTANYQTSGTYDTSNYRFTPGVAGNYQFIVQIVGNSQDNANLHAIMIKLYKNGSVLGEQVDGVVMNYATNYPFQGPITFNVTTASDANDYFEVYTAVNDTNGDPKINKYGSFFSGFLISGSA